MAPPPPPPLPPAATESLMSANLTRFGACAAAPGMPPRPGLRPCATDGRAAPKRIASFSSGVPARRVEALNRTTRSNAAVPTAAPKGSVRPHCRRRQAAALTTTTTTTTNSTPTIIAGCPPPAAPGVFNKRELHRVHLDSVLHLRSEKNTDDIRRVELEPLHCVRAAHTSHESCAARA